MDFLLKNFDSSGFGELMCHELFKGSDTPDAGDLFRAAALSESLGHPYDTATARYRLGEFLLTRRAPEARACLGKAEAGFKSIGKHPMGGPGGGARRAGVRVTPGGCGRTASVRPDRRDESAFSS